MADIAAHTREWAEVLDGTLAYLRAQAAAELDYAAVMRIERAAWRRARAILAELEGDAPPATDELLRQATDVEPVRQAVGEQVAAAPVDEGPEGMADEANRELSEEISEPEQFDEPDTAEEDIEDEDTAPPGAHTPMPTVRAGDAPAPAAEEPEDLDLDAIVDELPETEAEPEVLDLEAEVEAQREPESPAPLLPDFDFDDDSEEQDETVVFALGAEGGMDTSEAVARLIEEHESKEEAPADDDSFDLMPELDVEEEEEELEFEDLELESVDEEGDLELEPLSLDDDTDMGPPDMARAATPAGASARVTAGLYGNSNVPTIRDTKAAAPRAAAIQINATAGTGKMMGFEEEEEPLEIGAAEDYDDEYEDDDAPAAGGGFSLSIASDDYEDDEEWEDDDSEEEVASSQPAPVYTGPDLSMVSDTLARAHEAAAAGDMQAGVDLFSDVLDADPDHIDAYVGRGRLYLDLGDYSRAMSDFMTAEELDERNPEPQVAIGDLYFARKDYRKAIDYFNEALEMDPNHAMAHCRRGISHYYRKNYSDALADLKKAESMDPDIPNIGTYISMAKKKAKR